MGKTTACSICVGLLTHPNTLLLQERAQVQAGELLVAGTALPLHPISNAKLHPEQSLHLGLVSKKKWPIF